MLLYFYVCLTMLFRSVALPGTTGDYATEYVLPLVILKLPRSGSSWLTEKLNAIPSVFISKEIVQRGDRNEFSSTEIEGHFIKALLRPTGKLSSSKEYLPTGRFFEDYLFHGSFKFLNKMRIVGFTVNPEHCKDVRWHRVSAAVPGMRIVALIRSNMVKTALSGYRGKQSADTCGSSNLRHSSRASCTLPATVDWSIGEFARQVTSWQSRYDHFFRILNRIRTVDRIDVESVNYEDLQQNLSYSLIRVFNAVGLPFSAATSLVSLEQRSPLNHGWIKRSSEELRSILSHYTEIEEALVRGQCSCLLSQMRSTNATSFLPCHERFDAQDRRCYATRSRVV